MIVLREHDGGIVVRVRARPGARKDGVVGEHDGALRVAVSAAPEKGKANEALRGVLAEVLGCKTADVGLIAGETSREKTFLVRGMREDVVRERVEAVLQACAKG